MAIADRGFGSMDKVKAKAISAMGGRAAHKLGVAYEWTAEEAKAAGRKGGQTAAANRKKRLAA